MEAQNAKPSVLDRIEAKLFVVKAWIWMLAITVVASIAAVSFFTAFTIGCDHNDVILRQESAELRQKILNEGSPAESEEYFSTEISMRAVVHRSITTEYEGRIYHLMATPETNAADWLNFNSMRETEEYRIYIGFESCFAFELDSPKYYGVTITSFIQRLDQMPYQDNEGYFHEGFDYESSFDFDHLDFPFHIKYHEERENFDPEFFVPIEAALRTAYRSLFDDMSPVFAKFGIPDGRKIWENKIAEKAQIITTIRVGQAYLFVAPIAALGAALSFIAGMMILVKKKGVQIENQTGVAPNENVPLPPPGKALRIIAKTKLKPSLGEWVFRGVGLALLLAYSIYMGVVRIHARQGGGAVLDEFWNNAFQSLYALGSMMLILIVVIIIAESHRNLFRAAYLFFTAGFVYYVTMTGLMYDIIHLFVGENGEMFNNIVKFELPGNLFFGCGIFSFLGFFLFTEPNEAVISRKVFRLLSLLPVALASASIIVSIEMQFAHIVVPDYLSNLFFIKDPSFLFVGISLEYVIFFIRLGCRKKYGEQAEAAERLPEMQILKNIALCLLIALLTAIAYIIPAHLRLDAGLSCIYSIAFVSIPLFLFLKPGGKNRNFHFDILYYALFFFFTALPTIILYANELFFQAGA